MLRDMVGTVKLLTVLAGLAFVAGAIYVAVRIGGVFVVAFVVTVVVCLMLAVGSRQRRAAPK